MVIIIQFALNSVYKYCTPVRNAGTACMHDTVKKSTCALYLIIKTFKQMYFINIHTREMKKKKYDSYSNIDPLDGVRPKKKKMNVR